MGVGCGLNFTPSAQPHTWPHTRIGHAAAQRAPGRARAGRPVLFQGEALGVAGSRVGEEARTFKTNVKFSASNILIIKQS